MGTPLRMLDGVLRGLEGDATCGHVGFSDAHGTVLIVGCVIWYTINMYTSYGR